MSFQTLLYDLDGTLIDSLVDLGHAVNDLRNELGFPSLGIDEIAGKIGDGARLLVKRSLPSDAFNEQALNRFLEHYRNHLVEATVPYPGIIDCLEFWRGRPMAVVTNKPYDLSMTILERLNLITYFPVVVGGDTTSAKKPDPRPVRLALDRLGQPAETALMIGDHVNDLLAGQAAGTLTCFCRWGLGEHRNTAHDYDIDSPIELLELLANDTL